MRSIQQSMMCCSSFFPYLRSASVQRDPLCSTCTAFGQGHLQIPHLPSDKMPGPGRRYIGTATRLWSPPKILQKGTIVRRLAAHTPSWGFF